MLCAELYTSFPFYGNPCESYEHPLNFYSGQLKTWTILKKFFTYCQHARSLLFYCRKKLFNRTFGNGVNYYTIFCCVIWEMSASVRANRIESNNIIVSDCYSFYNLFLCNLSILFSHNCPIDIFIQATFSP